MRIDHDFEAGLSIIEDSDGFTITLITYYKPLEAKARHRPLPTPQYTLLRNYLQVYTSALSGIKTLHGDRAQTTISIQPNGIRPEAEVSPVLEPEAEETIAIINYNEHESPRQTMNSLGGLTVQKAELRKIINALNYPEFASFYGLEPTHFLLHGPAGTGKTSLVEAFAEEIDAELQTVQSSKIIDKWIGSSGKNIQELFNAAKEADGMTVVFFDEFESLAPKGDTSSSERIDVKNIIKQELTTISANYPHIIIAAATNHDPHDFDESVVRAGRLKPIYVGTPNEAERADIWSVILLAQQDRTGSLRPELYMNAPLPEDVSQLYINIDPYVLAQRTDGLTGADIKAVVQLAHFNAFAEAIAAGRTIPITQNDILTAIRQYQKP